MPGSIAPRVMGWQRRMGGVAGPLSASGEASNGDPVQVELYIDGSWVDITAYVMVRDNSGNISISRGRRDEGSDTEQSSLQMTLNNRDGRWSPRNPSGPYYGKIGRNTPVRVSVPNGLGGKSYRFQGEISVWPQSWDPTGTDVWTEVTGSGILRRLSQGPSSAHSVIYDAITDPVSSSMFAYWPCEDPAESKQIESALTNGSPMVFSSASPALGASELFTASDPLPTFAGATMTGGVIRYDTTTATQVRFFCYLPSVSLSDRKVIVAVWQVEDSGVSPAGVFELVYNTSTYSFSLVFLGTDGTNYGSEVTHTFDVRNRLLYVSLEMQESGTSTIYTIRTLDIVNDIEEATSLTRNTEGLNRCTSVRVFPASISAVNPNTTIGLSSAVVGHITVENAITSIDALGARLNPVGEAAGRRIQRLCGEGAVAFESVGDLDDKVAMGGQGRENPLSLMQECELADDGMLYETMPMLGLGYRTRVALCNQDAQLTLSYTGFNLSEVPTPVEDDRYVQNRVTVTVGGISQTYSLDTGTLSTELPPAGVGVYGSDVSLNLESSSEAESQAAWRVHLGTVDEPRYPEISVNLAHSSFTSNPALKQAVLGLRQGDRIVVQNVPTWLPPGDVDQLLLGFSETITHFEHRLTFTCAPASPYQVGVLDNALAVIDTDGSELRSAIGSGDTSFDVIPSAGQSGLWTTDSTNMPVDVRVGGEVMRVTAINDYLTDLFGRSVSNGWGTADTGQTWGTGGGTAADYAVGSGVGSHTLATVNASRRCFISSTVTNFDFYGDIASSALATGGFLSGGLTGRYIDSDNLYMARLSFTTSNTLDLTIRKRFGAVETQLGTYTLNDTYVAATYYRVRFQASGTTFKAKAWLATDAETPEWQITVTDSDISTASFMGVRSISSSANTNVNPVISYDNLRVVNPQTFTVTRSVNSVVKAQSAGADLRLAYPTIISL